MAAGYIINSDYYSNAIHLSINVEITSFSRRDDKSAGYTELDFSAIILEVSFGCSISVSLDLGQGVDVVDELLEGGVLGFEVGHLKHHLQVVEQTREVEVSPCELECKEFNKLATLLKLHEQK